MAITSNKYNLKRKSIAYSITKLILLVLTGVFFNACDATKKVGENQLLLTQNQIFENGSLSNDRAAYSQIAQQPNQRLALALYNLASEKTDSMHYARLFRTEQRKNRLISIFSRKQVDGIVKNRTGFSNWLKDKGEAPAIIRNDRAQRSTERLEEYYRSLGWFNAKASFEIIKDTNRNKRASIAYHIDKKNPYFLNEIEKKIESDVVDSIMRKNSHRMQIVSGNQFSRRDFIRERERVTQLMRNSGLFHFNQDRISFIADTVNTQNNVNIEYIIENRTRREGDSIIEIPFNINRISRVNIITDHSFENRNTPFRDSLTIDGYTFLSHNKLQFKPKTLINAIYIEPNAIYKENDRNLTSAHLNQMRVFRFPNISYEIDPDDPEQNDLIANITLTPQKKIGISIDFDTSISNIQQFGIGFSTSFITRNVFGGAEVLEISGRGSLGSSKDVGVSESHFFNISEVGGDIKLGVPKILFPLNTQRIIPRNMLPYTTISVGASSQNNIGLDRQTTNFTWNYRWRPSSIKTLHFDLLNINYIRNLNTDNYFNVYRKSFSRLNDIAINTNASDSYFDFDEFNNRTSLLIPEGADNFLNDFNNNLISNISEEQNQALRNIFQQKQRLTENNLIVASSFSWTRDSRSGTFDNQFSRIRLRLELAGNVLSGVSSLLGTSKNENDAYELFGISFSQYAKFDTEYIRHWGLANNNQLSLRLFGGIALPYGNSNSIPFSRSYFAGGPNDNRGWLPFRLGPGASNTGDEFNEANLKLATNLEYRFGIIGPFNGVVFADVGNIWNINNEIVDPDLSFNSLSDLKNIAVGSGFGIRYDFGFVVFRVDLGFKTYNPSRAEGNRWFNDYNFKRMVINFGVNYPF